MSRSAPIISFSVASVNYQTIDVDSSCAVQSYHIIGHGSSEFFTEAINMSISFKGVSNYSEAQHESWVWVSTAISNAQIASVGHNEMGVGSVGATSTATTGDCASQVVWTKVIVPSGAATAGAVSFYLHHRYQYTG